MMQAYNKATLAAEALFSFHPHPHSAIATPLRIKKFPWALVYMCAWHGFLLYFTCFFSSHCNFVSSYFQKWYFGAFLCSRAWNWKYRSRSKDLMNLIQPPGTFYVHGQKINCASCVYIVKLRIWNWSDAIYAAFKTMKLICNFTQAQNPFCTRTEKGILMVDHFV